MFLGSVGEQLLRRVEDAVAKAHEILGLPAPSGSRATLAELRRLISALAERLAVNDSEQAQSVLEERELALLRLSQRFDTRFDAVAQAQAAIAELREVTSPSEMLAQAPSALCASSTFDRALISRVTGGRMVAEAAHFKQDPGRADVVVQALRANPVRLEHPLIETELLRRRRATIVVEAQLHPRVDRRLTQLMGWTSYAAAPLLAGTQVVGVVHADRGPGRAVDALDRDILWEFVSGLSQAYESASLRRTLRREGEEMRHFLGWLAARSGERTDAPITLATAEYVPLASPEPHDPPALADGRSDQIVFDGLLTRRELEILRLLAEGHSNNAIAGALVISSGTVKFHVNSILRKLHAANRAEAVSRYLRLLGMLPP